MNESGSKKRERERERERERTMQHFVYQTQVRTDSECGFVCASATKESSRREIVCVGEREREKGTA